MAADNEVKMMMSVYPGAMTGFAALNAGLVSINNIFGNMTRAFDQQFDLLDTAITTTGVVVTQLGVDAMNAFGEFEQGMKIVQMVSGQTAQDIGYLSQKATEFSVQYRTDIDQITEGLQTLGRAGLNSATEQTEVLQNGLNTAKLEGRDLNSVLEELIQNTALLGGNLKSSDFGEESEYVNDLLVATSMTAPITTHDVSETLKYSGGIAAAAGANIESDSGKAILEDYMGAIAAFAQKGVTGSIAGTALRAFFNKPATQDSSVKDALASIKLKPEYLWEDDEEVMKPVSEQIKLIQDQMDKLNVSTMDRLQIWSKIVGGKMGQQMMKLDSSDIKELTKDIRAADDASDLAAGSMKTYQANVKALGESGAALQRDVGEKLVYFVNPILEFMNKFSGFLDNDIGASVLATSIIAFVGMLGKKIFDVIKIVKGELSTLMSGLKYHLGSKAGLAIGPDGKLVSTDGSEKGAPKNAMEFAKQYYGFSKGAELESLRKAGMTDADIARVGMFSTLKKDSTGAGMSDAEFVKRIYPSLSAAQKSQMDSLLIAAGGASRKPFDQMFLDEDKILKDEYRDLATKMGLFEESTRQATSALDAMKATFGNKTNKGSDWQKQYVQDAQAHVTALGNEANAEREVASTTESATSQVTSTVARGAATVVEDFNTMMVAISASVSNKSVNASTSAGYGYAISSNLFSEGMKYQRGMLHDLEKLRQELGIPKNTYVNRFSKDGMIYDPTTGRYVPNINNLFNEISQQKSKSGGGLPPNFISRYFYGDKGIADSSVPHYNMYGNVGDIGPHLSAKGWGAYFPAAGYQGRLPSQEAIDASLKANKEAEIKATQQATVEKQKETDLLRGQVAAKQAEIDQAEKLLIAEQQNAAAIDRMTTSASTFVAVMEGKWPNKPADGIWSPGLTDKQKQDKEGVHRRADLRAQRLEYKEANKKFLDSYKSGVKGVSVAQTEAERFRQEAKKQVNQLRNMSNLSRDEFAAAGGRYGNQLSYLSKQYSLTPQEIARRNEYVLSQNRDVLQRVQNNPIIMQNYSGNMGAAGGAKEGSKSPFSSITKSGVYQNFMKRISDDRQGRFLAFGTSAMGKLGNKALNVADMFGGPLMIAIMAVTTAIQMWQQAFQDYCEDLKEAGNKLKDAYSEWESAESSLRQTYQNGNPDATSEDIDQMVYDTYATMSDNMANAVNNGTEHWLSKLNYQTETGPEYEYDEESDDGTIKEKQEEEISSEEEYQKALQENTGALYTATAELNKALDNYVRKATDSWWGQDGWTGWLTDQFGGFSNKIMNGGLGSSFSDNQEFLLTQSQADENYAGYTEMAGLMLEDFKDAGGNWIAGMRTMMGKDVEDMAHLFAPGTSTFNYLKGMAQFSAGIGPGGLTSQKNAKLQASMKNDSKTWKKLGQELAKRDSAKKSNKNIEKQTSRINGLVNKLNNSMGNNFSKTQILQAAYLQQLQDMYQIAQQAIVPIMTTNMQTAMNTLSVAGQVDSNTGTVIGTTDGTYQNAAIIAGLVAIIARSKAKDLYFDTAVGGSTTPGHITDVTGDGKGDEADVYWINKAREEGMDANKFYSEFSRQYDEAAMSRKNIGSFGGLNPIWEWGDKGLYKNNDLIQEGALGYLRLYHATSKMEGFDYSPEAAADSARQFALQVRDQGISLNDAIKTAEKNYTMSEKFKQKIVDAYNAAGNEDEGSGGSGGSGSGSGDSDKNTGTRRERVDLVLCNKKEIPKLNVNLFKKPPSFTILNKNFKLRDVKINSEDKPKAIMAAIKNSFIDIQKRTDPKIIQDEDAVYDPKAATDGTNVPSGSAKTKTDNNS